MIDNLLAEFNYEAKIYEGLSKRLSKRYEKIRDIESKIITSLIETYDLKPSACYSQGHPHYKTPSGKLTMLKSRIRSEADDYWTKKIAFLEEEKIA